MRFGNGDSIMMHCDIRAIGLDKSGYQISILLVCPRKHMLWVLIRSALPVHENMCYSLEAPRRGSSNEYPQHMFSWTNKKNIDTFGLKNAP